MPTEIHWTDETWNWLVGCSRISKECDNCYAEVAAASPRLQKFPQYQGIEQWDGTIRFVENQLRKPLTWKKPKKIFTCSMSDVFHPNVLDEWRDRAFAVMAIANHHTYQILTKRPERMLEYFQRLDVFGRWANVIEQEFLDSPCLGHLIDELLGRQSPYKNIWLGTTAGCQESINVRLPLLDQLTQAGWTTFISAEPLLEEIHLGFDFPGYKVHQVIAGAESGHGARPMDENWVRGIRDQCIAYDVAFFYKQNATPKGTKIGTPKLDGKVWVEFPR